MFGIAKSVDNVPRMSFGKERVAVVPRSMFGLEDVLDWDGGMYGVTEEETIDVGFEDERYRRTFIV